MVGFRYGIFSPQTCYLSAILPSLLFSLAVHSVTVLKNFWLRRVAGVRRGRDSMPGSKKVQSKKSSPRSVPAKPPQAIVESIDRKQIEGELAQNNEFFHRLMESSLVCAYVKDEEGRYVYTNKAIERYLPRLLGKTDADLFSAEAARELRSHDLTALMTNGISKFDETTGSVDGALHWIS